jgi:electron transfer flavoprotein beta subunit
MNICVCIKQVPDVSASLQTGRKVLNAYDASAVEEALVLKAANGGAVDLVLAGPDSAKEVIRKALAMGADSATHLSLQEGQLLDSSASARILADFLASRSYDIILCGKQSQETDAGLTASMLAEHLNLPYTTNAIETQVESDGIVVTRQADSGQEIIVLPFPCLVSCSNDMNNPRIPSLKGIMQAKRKEIREEKIVVSTQVSVTQESIGEPPGRSPGVMFEGDPADTVDSLISRLRDEARVL